MTGLIQSFLFLILRNVLILESKNFDRVAVLFGAVDSILKSKEIKWNTMLLL